MQKYRALLLGGVCLGLVSIQAGTGIFAADEAPAEAPAVAAEPQEPAPAAAAVEEAAPPMTPPGVTWYNGDTTPATPPAFAAEATMNPDYTADATAAPAEAAPAEAAAPAEEPAREAPAAAEAPAAPAPAAAEAPAEAAPAAVEAPSVEAPAETAAEAPAPPMTPPGVTWYSGDTTPASQPAFAAEATMNPDYSAEAPAAAPAEAPAAAEPVIATDVPKTEDPVLPMTPPGVTENYGDTSSRETMPFRAEATVYPSAPEPAAAAAPVAQQQAVEACRDALNGEAQAGKINFATSAWDVLPDSFKTLDKIAKVAKDCSSNFVIEVGGHTDNTGKPASNKTISELRAQSVVKYLTKAGVDAAKLKAVGYGQDKPVGDNATVAGRRENRRIEFLVSGG